MHLFIYAIPMNVLPQFLFFRFSNIEIIAYLLLMALPDQIYIFLEKGCFSTLKNSTDLLL